LTVIRSLFFTQKDIVQVLKTCRLTYKSVTSSLKFVCCRSYCVRWNSRG